MLYLALILATEPVLSIWDRLGQLMTLWSFVTFLVTATGSFVIWREFSIKKQQGVQKQDESTMRSLRDGLSAASSRADEEKKRADQQQALLVVAGLDNAKLREALSREVADYLVATKTFVARISELEKKLESHE